MGYNPPDAPVLDAPIPNVPAPGTPTPDAPTPDVPKPGTPALRHPSHMNLHREPASGELRKQIDWVIRSAYLTFM